MITYDQLFVDVKLRFDMCRYFLRRYAKSGQLVGSLFSTCILVAEAQIFKVIYTLSLHQCYRLQVILDGSSIVVRQPALQSDVIVFGTPTNKVPLQETQHKSQIRKSRERKNREKLAI